MAKCPKCGRKLTILDWKPNCPKCGVNLVYYGMEERLMAEADAAEAEHARTQKKMDRLKAAFISSPLTIIRIVLSVLPIAMLLLPLANITFVGPFISERTSTIDLLKLIDFIPNLDFEGLFLMMGSDIASIGTGFLGLFGSLAALLLSVVLVIVSLLMLTMSCGKLGNLRNLSLNSLAIISAVASVVIYHFVFAKNMMEAFEGFVKGASVQWGAYVYIAALVLLLGINIVLAVKGIDVKYKQCFVGGIPAEEYFELVKKGTDTDTIHAMMAEALAKKAKDSDEAEEKSE